MKTLISNKMTNKLTDLYKSKVRVKSAETENSTIYHKISEKPLNSTIPLPNGCHRLFFEKHDNY